MAQSRNFLNLFTLAYDWYGISCSHVCKRFIFAHFLFKRSFFVTSQCDSWLSEGRQFITAIGKRATECKSYHDAATLDSEIAMFRVKSGDHEATLREMEHLATNLYGKSTAIT